MSHFNEQRLTLAFPIDTRAVTAHMSQDMRDDWFTDALEHRDLLNHPDALMEIVADLVTEGNGRYEGTKRTICDIPKKGLGIRYSLETDFYDRFVYQAICTYLIPYFDPLLSPRVLSHRFNKRRAAEKYLFKNRIDLWHTFEGVTYTGISSGQSLLATDLINYFENISVESIKSSFEGLLPYVQADGREKVLIRNAINTLCDLLQKWGYSDKHGLPQNRDPSAFIANIVLNTVDKKMVEMGHDYYRYVDDIRIICPDGNAAKKALITLIGELRLIGMNINSAKTKILDAHTSNQLIAEFFPATDDRTITIDNMWRSRSRRVIARSAKYISQIIIECIEKKETQSRQFRFATNRLLQLIDAKLFDIQTSCGINLTNTILDCLENEPVSTDQHCRLLAALPWPENTTERLADFLSNESKAIHPWQNYQLWLLLARKNIKFEPLIKTAIFQLETNFDSPATSSIFVYLSCIGEKNKLVPYVQLFSNDWPYKHQRHFLLATHDLDKEVLWPLHSKVGIKVRNTARRGAAFFNTDGHPLATKEPLNILQLFDEVNAYD
jgi:hypothetical protein